MDEVHFSIAYPEADFPWTLYFQGEPMPKWSNCWHWQGVADSDADWYVDEVHTRMDHTGVVESEESEVFVIAAQQMLLALIDDRDSFSTYPERSIESTRAIYANLVRGIQKMIAIAEQHDVVFWTSGYHSDRQLIETAIENFRVGPGHPDFCDAPHRIRRRRSRLFTLNRQRKEMRRRLESIGPNKDLKRFIHNLKDREEN